MSQNGQMDDSRLNALADGELDSSESQALLDEIKQDANMHKALCDIHLLKRLAYRTILHGWQHNYLLYNLQNRQNCWSNKLWLP